MSGGGKLIPGGDDTAPSAGQKAEGGKPCPNCGKPRAAAYKPFCSKRCADVDLARWLKGSYAIPAKDDAEDGEDGQ